MQKPISLLFSLFLASILACSNSDTSLRNTRNDAISGMISYRDNSKIPESGAIHIRLLEMNAEDNKVLEELTINAGGRGVPFPFLLPYDKPMIEEGKTYALDVDIAFADKNLYYTLEPVEVLSNGLKRDVSVMLVKGPKPQE